MLVAIEFWFSAIAECPHECRRLQSRVTLYMWVNMKMNWISRPPVVGLSILKLSNRSIQQKQVAFETWTHKIHVQRVLMTKCTLNWFQLKFAFLASLIIYSLIPQFWLGDTRIACTMATMKFSLQLNENMWKSAIIKNKIEISTLESRLVVHESSNFMWEWV